MIILKFIIELWLKIEKDEETIKNLVMVYVD